MQRYSYVKSDSTQIYNIYFFLWYGIISNYIYYNTYTFYNAIYTHTRAHIYIYTHLHSVRVLVLTIPVRILCWWSFFKELYFSRSILAVCRHILRKQSNHLLQFFMPLANLPTSESYKNLYNLNLIVQSTNIPSMSPLPITDWCSLQTALLFQVANSQISLTKRFKCTVMNNIVHIT